MFDFGKKARQAQEAALMRVMSEQQASMERILTAQSASNAEQAASISKMADAFSQYLQLFASADAPIARITRDEDEIRAELKRRGFPVDGTPEQQASWVLHETSW